MKTQFRYLLQHRTKRKKGDTARLAAQLAPLEEQKTGTGKKRDGSLGRAVQENGAIVIDNDSLSIPGEVLDQQPGRRILGMEPVVIVILCLMLTFIAFVAWQISGMPTE